MSETTSNFALSQQNTVLKHPRCFQVIFREYIINRLAASILNRFSTLFYNHVPYVHIIYLL